MTDLDDFKGTLASFSKISGLEFSVLDYDKVLFSTAELNGGNTHLRELAGFSGKVREKEKYLLSVMEDSSILYGVPVSDGYGRVLSLIALADDASSDRHKEMENLLKNMAGVIGSYWLSKIEVEKMATEIDQSFEELYLYSKIAQQVKTLRFTRRMQKELIEDLIGIMRVEIAFTRLKKGPDYNVLVSRPEIKGFVESPEEFVDRLIEAIPEDSISGEDSYFIVNDSMTDPGFSELHTRPFRFLAVKMKNNMDMDGWLGLVSFNLREIFRQSELSLLVTMAEQIAVVLSNQELYSDMERFVINVVKSLVQAIEAKDVYTRGHSERVNIYCMMIANELKLSEKDKKSLHWASMLHDIGKIAIPESILNKPARLTDSEYDIIKTHPEKGYEILKPIDQLKDSVEGLLYHHERYDGGGYPEGIRGEDIPFAARIIAVADTYDAITSNRAYRTAEEKDKAMKIIREVSGTQLDPGIVEAFDRLYGKGLLNHIGDLNGRQ